MNTLFNFKNFLNENINEKEQNNNDLEKLSFSNHIETFLTELNEMNENEVDDMLNENKNTLKNFGYELMEQKKNIETLSYNIETLSSNIESLNKLTIKNNDDIIKVAKVLNNVIQNNNLKQ